MEACLGSEAARPQKGLSLRACLGVGVLSEMTDKTVFNADHSGCYVFVAVICYISVTDNERIGQ